MKYFVGWVAGVVTMLLALSIGINGFIIFCPIYERIYIKSSKDSTIFELNITPMGPQEEAPAPAIKIIPKVKTASI